MGGRVPLARAAGVIALLALAGCSADGSGPKTMCTPPACQATQATLAVEVVPSMQDSPFFAVYEGPSITLDDSGHLKVAVEETVLVSGKVTIGGRQRLASGNVVATRPSRIPGRPVRRYQAQIDPSNGNYALSVPRSLDGERYTLSILSSEAALSPPQTFDVVVDGDVRFDLVLDDPDQLVKLSGVVKDPLGRPIGGMQVRAVVPETNEVVTSTAVTDAGGKYLLRLAKRATGMVKLRATPVRDQAPVGTPALETLVDVSDADPAGTITTNVVSPPLPVPARFSYPISGVDPDGAEVPVPGAQCTFTSTVSDAKSAVTATFTVEAQSGADGVVSVDLIPSESGTRDYDALITPPAASPFARRNLTVQVGPTGGYGQTITVALRPRVTGRVVDVALQPVIDLLVQPGPATVGDALSGTSLAEMATLPTAQTGVDGRFSVRLERGTWDLALIPKAQSGLPRRWLEAQVIEDDVDLADVYVPMGAMVRASVVDPGDGPLAGARVTLFAISPSDGSCESDACLAPPRPIAEALTLADGTAALILPAEASAPPNTR